MSVAVRTPAQQLAAQVRSDEFQEQVALALPEGMAPRRFVRAAVTALLQNPDLAQAEHNSLFQALIRAAQDGLLPDGKEAALVIFNTKVGDKWEKRAQYMSMIGGLRKIAAEYGWSLSTNVVYENDVFDYTLGLEPRVEHKPARLGTDRGKPIGAYAVGAHKDGSKLVEVLTTAEIEKVRGVSRSKDKGPWVDWWERMAEKTAGRRLFSKLPLGDRDEARISRVLEASDDPVTSATLMYGPGGAASLTPGGLRVDGRDATAGQQTGGTDTETDVVESPVPPVPDTDAPFELSASTLEAMADRASMFEVTDGRKRGLTLASVAVDDPGWFKRILNRPRPDEPGANQELWDNALAYARVYLPDAVPGGEA